MAQIITDKNIQVFFEILRAGLWEKEVSLSAYGDIDFAAIMELAEEQSVVGLITAGLERVKGVKVPKQWTLQFIGQTLQLEERNKAMNYFIGVMTDKMREAGIQSVLVKGQGVAQCYNRPLWRACGDVDLLLNAENYERAKAFLSPLASEVKKEFSYLKHIEMTFDVWSIELHGRFRSRLSKRTDNELDRLFDLCLDRGEVRVWRNDATDVLLPAPDVDVLFIFTHLLRHFFFEGVGLRQICDWCRLLWTFRDTLDDALLEQRLRTMGLTSEWKAFGAFAVEYLGMPVEAMPLLGSSVQEGQEFEGSKSSRVQGGQEVQKLKRKADGICRFMMKVGNFGHNQVRSTAGKDRPFLVRKFFSFWERFGFVLRHFPIFPMDSIRFFWQVMWSGVEMAMKDK